jgi:hypothetical protein
LSRTVKGFLEKPLFEETKLSNMKISTKKSPEKAKIQRQLWNGLGLTNSLPKVSPVTLSKN